MRAERPRVKLLACGLTYSAATIFALPPFSLWPLVFIATAALALAASMARPTPTRPPPPPRTIALYTGIGALPLWAVTHFWVLNVSFLGFFPLIAILAAYSALGVWITAHAARALPRLPLSLITAITLTAAEFFRADLLFHGYAWGLIGLPLIDAPPLAASATLFGIYAACFVAAAIGASAIDLWQRRIPAAINTLAITIAVCLFAWFTRPPLSTAPPLPIALIQTNVPQSNKIGWTIDDELRDWQRYEELIAQDIQGARADLVVIPETMMPGPTLSRDALNTLSDNGIFFNLQQPPLDGGPSRIFATAFADRLLFVQQELGIPILVGEEGVEGFRVEREDGGLRLTQDRRFNSVFLVTSGRISDTRYDKVRLTPFGEEMPYISQWDWLERQLLSLGAPGMAFDLNKGTRLTVFDIPSAADPVRVVTPICFEVTESNLCRRMVAANSARRADLFVNLTNDGWFTWSNMTRRQHLQFCRWRALETATPMARAANTGISAAIDARGNITASLSPDTDGVLIAELPPAAQLTLYARIGPIFPWTMLVLATLGLAHSFIRGRAASRSQEPHAGTQP